MLGVNNEFYGNPLSPEDALKINVVRSQPKEEIERRMYKDAAKRVVFWNCMGVCDLDNTKVPNFNRRFYYEQADEQVCL